MARTTVALHRSTVGAEVVLVFEQAIRVSRSSSVYCSRSSSSRPRETRPHSLRIEADDERFVVSAEREIVLRCGDASITLTRAGKVIIKGNYIMSRSTGYNKIKGAAIDIN